MRKSEALLALTRYAQGAAIIVFIVVLFLARDVFIPLALGILVAFLLSPLVTRLQQLGLKNSLAVVTTTALVLTFFVAFVYAIGSSVSDFAGQLPSYKSELQHKVSNLKSMMSSGWGKTISELSNLKVGDGATDQATSPLPQSESSSETEVEQPDGTNTTAQDASTGEDSSTENVSGMETPQRDGSSPSRSLFVAEAPNNSVDFKSWAGGAASLLGPIGTAGLVTVFAIFILLYRDDLRDRIVNVISQGNYVITSDAFNEASERIGRYLLAQLTLNIGYGTTFALGLLAIGYFMTPERWFPYVAVLGTVAGLARFIPYLGPLMGAALPLVLSFLFFPGYKVVVAVAVLIILMELVSNNIVEPWLYGSSTGVSPMAIILAAVFWGWLWGPIGLLLATPLTVCAVVIGQYVPRFRFLSTLLSDQILVPQAVRGYQRLLSGHQFRVNEFIKNEAAAAALPELLDKTVIPTIKLILRDQQKRDLSDEQLLENLREAMRAAGLSASLEDEIVNDPMVNTEVAGTDPQKNTESIDGDESPPTVPKLEACAVAAGHSGERIVLESIQYHLVESYDLKFVERSDYPDLDAAEVAALNPDLVLITMIPPSSFSQTCDWCSTLRRSGYRGQIIVAGLGKFRNHHRMLAQLKRNGANLFVTTAHQLLRVLKRYESSQRARSNSKKVATVPNRSKSDVAVGA